MIEDQNQLAKFQGSAFEWDNTSKTIAQAPIFGERVKGKFNYFTLFTTIFSCLPNNIIENAVDVEAANTWFVENYKHEIKDSFFSRRSLNWFDKSENYEICYLLHDDLFVIFEMTAESVSFLFRKTAISKVEDLVSAILKFQKKKKRNVPKIGLLVSSDNGIGVQVLQISKPKLKIQDNYNDDFEDIHKTILKRLSKKNDSGLVLLHGKPGTGKTSYIRYLIASLKKEVIFLPSNMASFITEPGLLKVFINRPNSVFVIEDAENIVIDREVQGVSPVSALLNISDGLLGDCLNVHIICSFNTDISKIDTALLRKGRLIAKYEFKELVVEKAQQLSDKIGFTTRIEHPMSLTSIYNQEQKDFQTEKVQKPIGFQKISEN